MRKSTNPATQEPLSMCMKAMAFRVHHVDLRGGGYGGRAADTPSHSYCGI